ncbi:MAG: UvrD-helicase domain-containing protein [Dehalococcoidia bacterium]|nr:UvrD-helicase domain-containing protein [Dehalococcoidia bacterium]
MTIDGAILRGLNPEQRRAVETVDGPVLIVAGPGSGKTRVISHRVAYLLKERGVPPWRVMAVTFTNKAANEMKERIAALIGGDATDRLTIGTFHAICARILRAEGDAIGIDRRFAIFDDDDQLRVMKQTLADLRLDEGAVSPRAVLSAISRRKAELIGPDDPAGRGGFFDEIVQRAYRGYQQRLAESRGLDFDDLISETVRLLTQSAASRERLQDRYLHVMVDEFQDTNVAQYALVQLLAGKHRNLAVVGDPDQSIYGFRSADIRNILNFERDFPDATVVRLDQNYRSTQRILDAAQGVIAGGRARVKRALWTDRGEGHKIVVRELLNELDEARFVVQEIDKLRARYGYAYRDCAVMYRTNGQSRTVEQAFITYGAPYRLVGGVRFYERKEVKDVLAYLRVANTPQDSIALARVINTPPRGIGQKTIDEITRWATARRVSLYEALKAAQAGVGAPLATRARAAVSEFVTMIDETIALSEELPLPYLIDRFVTRANFREHLLADPVEGPDRWENVQQVVAAAMELRDLAPRDALAQFLDDASLFTSVDTYDSTADAVTLITLHAAKGLEYPVVFIIGLEEGILPHSRSIQGDDGEPNEDALEEERRLLYVGITRAKERLYLLRAFRRAQWGRSDPLPPSRFLDDIPPEAREPERRAFAPPPVALPDLRPSAPKTAPPPIAPAFKVGDIVRQPLLGEGRVVAVTPTRGDVEVTVQFARPAVGTKKLLQSLARLEKIRDL